MTNIETDKFRMTQNILTTQETRITGPCQQVRVAQDLQRLEGSARPVAHGVDVWGPVHFVVDEEAEVPNGRLQRDPIV